MATKYVTLIADIPKQELELWQDLLFSLRMGLGIYANKQEWLESFKTRKYVYISIDDDKYIHVNTVNSMFKNHNTYESITLELLKTLNLLKLTGK